MQTTKAMRDRIKELATPERDDFDRAVNLLLADFEQAVKDRDEWQAKWLECSTAALILAPEAQ